MAAPKRTIPVLILGQEYRIRSDADEAAIRRAAELVDDTMEKVRQRTGTVDSQSVAVLAALNIANQLIAQRESPGGAGGAGVAAERIGPLLELVEGALREGAPAAS